jgi:hypothetical protein
MIALNFVAEILTQGVCKKRKLARWRMKMSVYILSSNSSTQSHARGWQRRDSEKSVEVRNTNVIKGDRKKQ